MAATMTSSVTQSSTQCLSHTCHSAKASLAKNVRSVSFRNKSLPHTKLSSSIFGSPFVANTETTTARSFSQICLAMYSGEDFEETEEDITAAYEALYGKAFANLAQKNLSETGDDADEEESGRGKRGKRGDGDFEPKERRGSKDAFEEQVIQVRRVTKVVKGGKQLAFRAVVVLGDRKGTVGVGVGKAKEVVIAVQKSAADARRHLVSVPMTKYLTFPHRAEGTSGAAKVMLRPAAPGTGVIAGGAVRVVLELAGVENALGKELGSGNPLNNARAVLNAAASMKQFSDVAKARNIPMEELWK